MRLVLKSKGIFEKERQESRSVPRALYKSAKGFTLVEMMVVLVIITTITTITLLGHSNFDRSLLISDTAYSMALSLREMQTFGLSSRAYGTGGSAIYNAGYGIHLSSATPISYVLFADSDSAAGSVGVAEYCPRGTVGTPDYKPGNCLYVPTSSDGLINTYTLTRGFTIGNFCGKDVSGTRYCSNSGSTRLQALDAIFIRPNTDSIINGQKNTAGTPWVRLTTAEIYLQTGDAASTRGICVSSIGQISVVNGSCP
jgi:prepilin-type N-terminal cleavage/methylation domain-containing protein